MAAGKFSKNRFVLGVLVVIGLELIALGAFYLYVRSGGFNMNADAEAGGLEHWVGHLSTDSWVESSASKQQSPVPVNDQTLIHGAQLYQNYCAFCHGGAQEPESPLHHGSYPDAPQFLSRKHEMHDPEGEIFYVIQHGIRFTGMPAWQHALSDQDMWTLVNFLKHYKSLPPAVQQAWDQMPASPAVAPRSGSSGH